MTADSHSAIRAAGLGKVFGGRRGTERVEALRHIDLTVETGEFISLIGPSGCGKSTFLRLVGDLVQPSTGSLEVNGTTPHEARLNREYGMVFQHATLLEWRTVLHNVMLPLEIMDYPKTEREDRAREMLDLVQLGDFSDHHP